MRRGQWIDPSFGKIRLEEWAADFLAGAHELSPSSLSTYRRDLDKYVLPRFGTTPIDRISKAEIPEVGRRRAGDGSCSVVG